MKAKIFDKQNEILIKLQSEMSNLLNKSEKQGKVRRDQGRLELPTFQLRDMDNTRLLACNIRKKLNNPKFSLKKSYLVVQSLRLALQL